MVVSCFSVTIKWWNRGDIFFLYIIIIFADWTFFYKFIKLFFSINYHIFSYSAESKEVKEQFFDTLSTLSNMSVAIWKIKYVLIRNAFHYFKYCASVPKIDTIPIRSMIDKCFCNLLTMNNIGKPFTFHQL